MDTNTDYEKGLMMLECFKENSRKQIIIERTMQTLRQGFPDGDSATIERAKHKYNELAKEWELLEQDKRHTEYLIGGLSPIKKSVVTMRYQHGTGWENVDFEICYNKDQAICHCKRHLKKATYRIKSNCLKALK